MSYGSRKTPLRTALAPAIRVTRILTVPVTRHIQYWPPAKLVTIRVSSTTPVVVSVPTKVTVGAAPGVTTTCTTEGTEGVPLSSVAIALTVWGPAVATFQLAA